jgi:uncharacterized protein (TIGR02145 family)
MKYFFRITFILIIILSGLIVKSCKKDKPAIPVLTTTAVSGITSTTAISGGNVIASGGAEITAKGVCWSTAASPSTANSKTSETGTTGSFTSNITQLVPNTMYYVRAYATSSAGTGYGEQVTFSTNQVAVPSITTTAVTSVTQTTAFSGGNISADNGASVTARGLCWGLATSPTTSGTKTSDGTGTGTYTSSITGLKANTTYHARAYATNSAGTSYGNELSFTTTTSETLSDVITSVATAITQSTATLNGTVNAKNTSTTISFEYGLTTSYGQSVYATPNTLSNNIATNVTSNLAGLTANTTYHFRVKAVTINGTTYGSDMTFTTNPSGVAPTATTQAATSVSQTGATVNGTINANGQSTTVTFEYGTTSSYGFVINANPNILTSTTATNVSAVLTGFSANTTYHYRVKAASSGGTTFGNDLTFTTGSGASAPTATTTAATAVTQTGASLNGTVNANGQSTTVTFEYGITTSYGQIINASPNTITGNISTTVSANLTGLTANTTYHYKVKAVSQGGTTNGSDMTFTTSNTSGTSGNSIQQNATVKNALSQSGITTYDGNTPPSLQGTYTTTPMKCNNATGNLSYMFNQNLNSVFKLYNQTTSGEISFMEQLPSGLWAAGTGCYITGSGQSFTIWMRTTLSNGAETCFVLSGTLEQSTGNLVSCKSVTVFTIPSPSYNVGDSYSCGGWIQNLEPPISDIDGNIYKTVIIGTQVWMKENLKTTKYRNGDLVGTITPSTVSLTNEVSPKYQWAYNDNEANAAIYGRLYTWYAVTDNRKICPAGWHVPSVSEWTILGDYLTNNGYGYGGSGNLIAKSMASTSGWNTYSTAGTPGNDQTTNNKSGFTGLPSGSRGTTDGKTFGFFGIGYNTTWWATNSSTTTTSGSWFLGYNSRVAYATNATTCYGFSVRCIKDN